MARCIQLMPQPRARVYKTFHLGMFSTVPPLLAQYVKATPLSTHGRNVAAHSAERSSIMAALQLYCTLIASAANRKSIIMLSHESVSSRVYSRLAPNSNVYWRADL